MHRHVRRCRRRQAVLYTRPGPVRSGLMRSPCGQSQTPGLSLVLEAWPPEPAKTILAGGVAAPDPIAGDGLCIGPAGEVWSQTSGMRYYMDTACCRLQTSPVNLCKVLMRRCASPTVLIWLDTGLECAIVQFVAKITSECCLHLACVCPGTARNRRQALEEEQPDGWASYPLPGDRERRGCRRACE